MASRTATSEVRVMFSVATHRRLREHSAARGEPIAVTVRRFVERGLAVSDADAQAQVLAKAVSIALRHEILPTRTYAYRAAFAALAALRALEDISGVQLYRVAGLDRGQAEDIVAQQMATWRRYAAERVGDPEPADPSEDAPAEALPNADAEVELDET